jgi:hypothetical protein
MVEGKIMWTRDKNELFPWKIKETVLPMFKSLCRCMFVLVSAVPD